MDRKFVFETLGETEWWIPMLRAWVAGESGDALESLADALDVPRHTACPRADAAVARLVLGGIQNELPRWAIRTAQRMTDARLPFRDCFEGASPFYPTRVVAVDWTDEPLCFHDPEDYHLVHVPVVDRWIATAARGSDELMGCTEHAIGHRLGGMAAKEAARELIVGYWQAQVARSGGALEPWLGVIAGRIADSVEAHAWRDLVWPPKKSEEDEEVDVDAAAAAGTVPIVFTTVLVRADAVASVYPDRPSRFLERHGGVGPEHGLYRIPLMSTGEIDHVIDRLEADGLRVGHAVAIADMHLGRLASCPGIRIGRVAAAGTCARVEATALSDRAWRAWRQE